MTPWARSCGVWPIEDGDFIYMQNGLTATFTVRTGSSAG